MNFVPLNRMMNCTVMSRMVKHTVSRSLGVALTFYIALTISNDCTANSEHSHHSHHLEPSAQSSTKTVTDAHTSPTLPIEPIPVLNDADRAAAFPELQQHMHHAPQVNYFVLFDRLEQQDSNTHNNQSWRSQAWVGSDLDRLWLRSEGERQNHQGKSATSATIEAFYGHSVSPWWDLLIGVKHDLNPESSTSWAALGIQGHAPYKFDVQATAYLSEHGQIASTVEIDYELLLSQRLILQSSLEAALFGQDRLQSNLGAGLSSAEVGLRLRYEINRKFAPYLGIAHEHYFGNTAELRQHNGEQTEITRIVAGVRFWF